MKTMAKRSILAGAAAVALSFCALTAFAAPTIESNGADTASVSPPSALSEHANSPLTFTIKTAQDGGVADVSKNQFTDLKSALDAIPDDAGAVIFRIESDLHTDYREYDGGRKRVLFNIPADKGITSFTIEGAKADETVTMGSGGTAYSISVFANGVPITVQGDITMNAFVYGGADASGSDSLRVSGSSSITVEEGATVSYVYGGSYNTDFDGDSAIVINGSATDVIGGCRAFAHAYEIDSRTLSDAAATMRGSSSIVIGPKGTVSGLIAGGGDADAQNGSSVTPSQPDALSSTATLEGSTSIMIDGAFDQVYGGGSADAAGAASTNPMPITATSNVSGDASVIIGSSARIEGFYETAFGGGKAQTSQSVTGYATANVGGSTAIEVLGDDAAKTDEKQAYFSRLGGGGYATNPYAEANVGGSTTVKTARATSSSHEGMMGGGYALRGATANVAGTSHVEVFGIEGQREDYSNAKCVIGGGFALVEDAVETSATTGSTEVVVHAGAQLESISTAPSVGLIGGGYAAGGNSDASVAGASSVIIEGGTPDKQTVVPDGIVGGGIVYKQNFSSYLEGSSSKADVAGGSTVTVGDFCTLKKSLVGGGLAYGPTAKNASARTGDVRVETGHDVAVWGEFVAAGKALNSSNSNVDARNTVASIGANSTLSSYVIGGGYVTGSYPNMSANVESIDVSVGEGTAINGNFTVGGGFANNATDSEASVLGNVRTTFGDNVKTKSFVGGGFAYNGSNGCTVDVKGAVGSTFGNSYADPYEFIAAGYVFYNTTSCTADAGAVETTFGENAALSDVSGAGWVRSNSNNGSADVGGSASFTLGRNSELATKFVGGGQVQASTASHANVGAELGSDGAAVTTKMAAGLTLPLMYGGGCVSSSTDSQADIAGSVENRLDGESSAGSFTGSFNGGGCVKDSSTNGQADIAGSVESTLTGFSFASAGADYLARVVGNGAVLGSSASHASTKGDVTTRLASCTINGSNDGNNSLSMPYLGGRSDSDVDGNATLILQDSKLVNQTLRTQKTYSGAIGGTLTVQLVGSMEFDKWSHPDWKDREVQLVFGDDVGTPTDVTMIGVLCYNSPMSATVLPHATVSLTNGFDNEAYHLLGLRNLTVSEDASLAVTASTAQAKLSGNLSGAGTISLPAGGSIVGEGVLDGSLALVITEDKATASAGQTYFEFSDLSTGSVTLVDLDGTLKLADASDAGRRTWTIAENTHTVAFDSLEGSDVEKQTIIHGGHAVEPDPAPTREHYALEGWYGTADFSSDPWSFDADVVTEDVTLYAKWTPVEYTVTFDACGGSPTPLDLQVKYGATVTEPAQQPTKANFMFAGWYADASCQGDPWDFADDTVSGDLTLHARWIDGIPVSVAVKADEQGAEHGSVDPSTPQIYTGKPLKFTLTPDYGYQIGSVTVNGDPLSYELQKDLRSAIVTYTPTAESSIVVTYAPLNNETASDIIENLPTVEPDDAPDVVEEKKDAVLDAKLDYESMSDDEKEAVEQVVVDKLNEAVTSLPNVNVRVELAISPELDTNVEIPEKDQSRFIGAVSKDEIEQLKNGAAQLLKVVVNIKNIESPENEDEKAALESSLGSLEIGQHFSASVTKQLFADPTGSNPLKSDPITTLPAPVQLTFQVSQFLLHSDEGTTRSFCVARTHFSGSWQAELRPDEDGDETNESVTISTDRFSTYSIAYQDTHTVTFMDGASVLATAPVANGGTLTKPADPTREGYEFDGWYASDDFAGNPYGFDTPVTGSFTLYAKWAAEEPPAPAEHAVSFESNGGSPVDAQRVAYGEAAAKPADPAREGYDFAGWYADAAFAAPYDFDAPVTSDLVLYAKWDRIYNEVTFSAGDGVASPDAQRVAYGEKVAKPADPEKAGYAFAGWYADAGLSGDAYDFDAPVTGPVTLYAKWIETAEPPAVEHEVAFVSNGGTPVDPQTVADGELATAPDDPTREGYEFAGWYADAGFTAAWDFDRNPVTEPVTLYAKWERIERAVSFESNGGTAVAGQAVAHGDKVPKPADPAREGYEFDGWYADEGLATPYDFNTPVISDLVLYAKWAAEEPPAPAEHSVSFESNGGSLVDAQRVADGEAAARPADPVREGYDFAGWYADAALAAPYDFDAPVTADLVLYAKWTAKTAPLPTPDEDVAPQQPDTPKELPASSSTTAEKLAPTGDAATLPLAIAGVALVTAGALTLRARRTR